MGHSAVHIPDPALFSDWVAWARRLHALQARENIASEQNPSVDAPRFPAASLPSAVEEGQMIYVPDDAAGTVMAFSDGAQWINLARMSDLPVAPTFDFQTFSATGLNATSWTNVPGATARTMPGTPDGSQKYLFSGQMMVETTGSNLGTALLGLFCGPNGTVADTLVAACSCSPLGHNGSNNIQTASLSGFQYTPGASDVKWGVGYKSIISSGTPTWDILNAGDYNSHARVVEIWE